MYQNLLLLICATICITKCRAGDEMIGGPAELNIKSITECPDPEQYKYVLNVNRHKVNRTHEAFDGGINLGVPLDEKVGIYINVAKKTKDVYKPNAFEFKDEYACAFLLKWVGKGFQELLRRIEQPETCPIQSGNYAVKNFLIDFRQMPQTLPYGDFRADVFLTKDGESIICTRVFLVTQPLNPFNG